MVLALGFVGSRYSSHLVLRTLLFRGISVQGLGVAVYIVAMPRALNDRRERGNGFAKCIGDCAEPCCASCFS